MTFKAPNDCKIYVNGKEMMSSDNGMSTAAIQRSFEKIRIGLYKGNNNVISTFLDGELRDFALYDVQLSASDVLDHYDNGISSSTSNMVVYYPLNETASSSSKTVSNKANSSSFDATMMGSPKIIATACGSTLSSIETKINELNIYPNPTRRKFKINSPTEFKLVTLYNVNGQEVYHTTIVDNVVNGLEAL